MKKILILLLLLPVLALGNPESLLLPDAKLTPGASDSTNLIPVDLKTLCTPGYTKTVRNVPEKLKREVFASYGITRDFGKFEVDHLTSLQLGGNNTKGNLWPQSYLTKSLNARRKDVLEGVLHRLVCKGKMPLAQAQKEISENWIEAYKKYVDK